MDTSHIADHISQQYEKVVQCMVDNNQAKFEKGIDVTKSFPVCIIKKERYQEFAKYVGIPISESDMVTKMVSHAVTTGMNNTI